MPAKLRMNLVGRPGMHQMDFELWSLAVPAIDGCGMCVETHNRVVKHGGATSEQVQAVVRIASVVHAIAATLVGEAALAA